jgi:hypothetical protein
VALSDDYQILGVKVGRIPAKGHLSDISLKKYGPRENESDQTVDQLLKNLKLKPQGTSFLIKSDAKPNYRKYVKKYFPKNPYQTFHSGENKEKRRLMNAHGAFGPTS